MLQICNILIPPLTAKVLPGLRRLALARPFFIGGLNNMRTSLVLAMLLAIPAASLANAKRQNDAAVRKLLGVFRQFAIDPTDAQTAFMTVDIRYNSSAQTVVDDYVVEKTIAVTLKKVARFEEILGASLGRGRPE
jgi:uncharacterized protein YggE